MEIWKDVPGYENFYQVSSIGRIKSLPRRGRKQSRILKPTYDRKGYLGVDLFKDKERKRCRVHRLVALSFIPNPENKPEVNHIDGIKTNNVIENLEWNTTSENLNHRDENDLVNNKGEDNYRAILNEKQVLEIKHTLSKESGYGLLKRLAKQYRVHPNTISDIKKNRTWKHV